MESITGSSGSGWRRERGDDVGGGDDRARDDGREGGGVSEGSLYLAVIPAYNESATIEGVVKALREHAPRFDTLVVDDGSTDDTGELALGAGARVIRLPFNVGIGGAVQTGFVYAREHGYDYLAQVDGDGQHDSLELERLIAAMDEEPPVDMVCGSRFLTDEHRYPAPIGRRTGIHIFSFVLSRMVGMRVSDPTSGFRLYNRRAIELFARDYPHDYPEVEAVMILHHHRLRMREVPVRMHTRGGGSSSIGMGRSAYYMVKVLLALFVGMGRRRIRVDLGEGAPAEAKRAVA
jgi:glycosyltransferase involved in cell wall biosynthesis